MNRLVLLMAALSITLSGCEKSDESMLMSKHSTYAPDGKTTQPTATVSPEPVKHKKQEGKRLTVPSDPNAEFYVMDKTKTGGESVITTKRVGSSGVGYSRRLYDCQNNTVKYLGSGDTLQAMEQSSPDPNMTPIVSGSIADYVGQVACK